jgi:hypothetical protein
LPLESERSQAPAWERTALQAPPAGHPRMQWLTNKSRRQQIECACYIDFGLKAKACCENFSAHPFFALPDRAPSAFLCASAFKDNQLIHEKVSAKPTGKFHVVVHYRYRLLNCPKYRITQMARTARRVITALTIAIAGQPPGFLGSRKGYGYQSVQAPRSNVRNK